MKRWKQQQQQQQEPIVLTLEQQRAEKLAQIGATLRRRREDKQISLERIESTTRIRQSFLRAIEAGNIDKLPEPVYIRGFIKQYAEALDLDGTELANSFPLEDYRQSLKPVGVSLPPAQLHTSHLYAIYILLIIGAVSILSQTLSNSDFQIGQNTQSQPPLPVANVAKPKASATVKPVANLKKQTKPVEVDITVKDKSWIRVTADGKKEFEGELSPGTQRKWVANEQLKLEVGNAGGVLVTYNQEEAKLLGQLGQVQRVTFRANNPRL
ncbi:helix-turn-helix domain-containing protein [Chroococcidiopsis sp. FACHB-1243]|uniref:helix-turn-helix domain-containing protein n=1 Tax=Chroococcidiopsis sp. [FACHB-1243] TaxID=2692781 RepID=UPI00178066B1|nr:RodZ domain-containing protein [Chroococcidiopsis sp. [FACHB-1243]]MBD2306136.1 helix-turn-helix domain-containing protein [Chroococcidiopsis sp. [FACHB-1243]]